MEWNDIADPGGSPVGSEWGELQSDAGITTEEKRRVLKDSPGSLQKCVAQT